MTSTLPYRPSEDTFDTFPASGTTSNRPKTNGLPRLTPSPSVLKRSPSSQTSLRRPSNHVAIPHSASNSSKPRRCKSQYPLDSPERHVEYILVASFHIDRGPIMEHQYPAPISGDESMLAELMLPDQTHVRSQDWTIFFLHKDTSAEDEEESLQEKKKKRKNKGDRSPGTSEGNDGLDDDPDASGEDSSDEEDSGEGPPLMYVLNLVNTKQDNTVKRYVYPLYDLLAAMGLTNCRGAVVKAMAICTRHSFLHIYKVSQSRSKNR